MTHLRNSDSQMLLVLHSTPSQYATTKHEHYTNADDQIKNLVAPQRAASIESRADLGGAVAATGSELNRFSQSLKGNRKAEKIVMTMNTSRGTN